MIVGSGRLGLLPRMLVRMDDSTIYGHVYATMIPSPAHASSWAVVARRPASNRTPTNRSPAERSFGTRTEAISGLIHKRCVRGNCG